MLAVTKRDPIRPTLFADLVVQGREEFLVLVVFPGELLANIWD